MQETTNRKSPKAIEQEYVQVVEYIKEHGPTPDLELSVKLDIPGNRITKILLKAFRNNALEAKNPPYGVMLGKSLPLLIREWLKCQDSDLIRIDSIDDTVALSIVK
ncbi:hypothetical protein C4J81_16065 [Deltaproteobacteria bacterium Smac51]|nr:hypothetical protein C4J81_16065 [Deltaproteobacteria bacterium Smac51]